MAAQTLRFGVLLAAVTLSMVPIVAAQRGPQVFGAGVHRAGAGVTPPVVVNGLGAKYTAAAFKSGIEGVVEVDAVVLADGTVGDLRIARSLDSRFGLDQQALDAARRWRFTPGTKDGAAVAVHTSLVFEFQLLTAQILPETGTPDPQLCSSRRPGLVMPVLVRDVRPAYTSDALMAGVSGTVEVEGLVDIDGRVKDVIVTKSLDPYFGLDHQAVHSARAWLFQPARLGVQPVACVITFVLEFRLPATGSRARGNVGSVPSSATLQLQSNEDFTRGAMRPREGVIAPTIVEQRRPEYTPEATRQRTDDQALAAVKQWRFQPNSGTFQGRPVPIVVATKVEFRLQ